MTEQEKRAIDQASEGGCWIFIPVAVFVIAVLTVIICL